MLNNPTDTLVCDTSRVALFQSNPAYAYSNELSAPDMNLFEWLVREVGRLLRSFLGSFFEFEGSWLIILIIAVVLLIFIGWAIYVKRPGFFIRSRKSPLTDVVSEDNIYGIDFNCKIAEALQQNNYREAVRFVYLQTLKQLSDNKRIDWQLYKTPTQYIYEVRMKAFQQLTNGFLRVRYGNFDATSDLFHEMQSLQKEIEKGVNV